MPVVLRISISVSDTGMPTEPIFWVVPGCTGVEVTMHVPSVSP